MLMDKRSFMSLGPHGFHRIAYYQWGNAHARKVAVCVHGLTRTGRDFDAIATALTDDDYRVACPDLPGRGESHWLASHADYAPPVYMADMAALMARMGAEQVDWIGTSLGGMVGMMLAAQPNTPIRRLVLNDVGPFISKVALARIAEYVGADPQFPDLKALEAYLREVHAPFGPLTDEQWAHLAEHSVRHDETGALRLHYDPGIGAAYREGFSEDVEFWAVWDAVSCPVLVLRGAQSDILLKETADEMLTRGPTTEIVEFPDLGHAPMLMDRAQIRVVRDWLAADE